MIVPLKKVTIDKSILEKIIKSKCYKDSYSITIQAVLFGETEGDFIHANLAAIYVMFTLGVGISIGFIAGALIASITI